MKHIPELATDPGPVDRGRRSRARPAVRHPVPETGAAASGGGPGLGHRRSGGASRLPWPKVAAGLGLLALAAFLPAMA